MAEETQYPGIEFTPPEGMDMSAEEGEALVKWQKVGDRFTIVEFDGTPLSPPMAEAEATATMDGMREELEAMDSEEM